MLSFLSAEYRSLPTDDESSLAADRKPFVEKFRKESEKKLEKWQWWNTALERRHHSIGVSILCGLGEAKMSQPNMIKMRTFPEKKEMRFFFITCLKRRCR